MTELFEVVLNRDDKAYSRQQLIDAVADCDVLVPTVTDQIDAQVIAAAKNRLGLIANFGAGVDHIDLTAAKERDIIVTNTPGVFTDDTAESNDGDDYRSSAPCPRGDWARAAG